MRGCGVICIPGGFSTRKFRWSTKEGVKVRNFLVAALRALTVCTIVKPTNAAGREVQETIAWGVSVSLRVPGKGEEWREGMRL